MSTLKFIVDVCCGESFYLQLKLKSFDVIFADDIKVGLSDSEIILIAKDQKRIIITLDSDFGTLVFKDHYKHSGILYLRLKNELLKEKIAVFDWIMENYSEDLANNYSVYTSNNHQLRIR